MLPLPCLLFVFLLFTIVVSFAVPLCLVLTCFKRGTIFPLTSHKLCESVCLSSTGGRDVSCSVRMYNSAKRIDPVISSDPEPTFWPASPQRTLDLPASELAGTPPWSDARLLPAVKRVPCKCADYRARGQDSSEVLQTDRRRTEKQKRRRFWVVLSCRVLSILRPFPVLSSRVWPCLVLSSLVSFCLVLSSLISSRLVSSSRILSILVYSRLV